MALVWAFERFDVNLYAYGLQTFDLVTDHEALKVIYARGSKPGRYLALGVETAAL